MYIYSSCAQRYALMYYKSARPFERAPRSYKQCSHHRLSGRMALNWTRCDRRGYMRLYSYTRCRELRAHAPPRGRESGGGGDGGRGGGKRLRTVILFSEPDDDAGETERLRAWAEMNFSTFSIIIYWCCCTCAFFFCFCYFFLYLVGDEIFSQGE